ncbi:MAG: VOC family protein [Solirubrobacterales bacterium]|nr:VOC family protein [Solirubrobacterales bacterium]
MLEGASVHTTLPAQDMERAGKFYEEKVGAKRGKAMPGAAFFSLGDTEFSLYSTPNTERGGHTQMGIRVADARAAVEELRARGVVFEEYDFPGLKTEDGIADMGDVVGGWFKDTEGNIIGVVQVR